MRYKDSKEIQKERVIRRMEVKIRSEIEET
jgi:hypothetical protein